MIVEIILILDGLFFGLFVTWLFELVLKTNKRLRARYYRHHEIFFGYHIHHSTYGILTFILSIIFLNLGEIIPALFFIGFSLGIIIMHTISDGKFVFIEKQKM